jgi:hypothetical protein
MRTQHETNTPLLCLLARVDDGCGVVTVGRSSLPAHDPGLRAARSAVAGDAAGPGGPGDRLDGSAASLQGGGAPPPAAIAPIATPSPSAPSPPCTPAATARPTATPPSAAGGGTAASVTRLDPRFRDERPPVVRPVETAASQIDMLADDGLGVVRFRRLMA